MDDEYILVGNVDTLSFEEALGRQRVLGRLGGRGLGQY
jgi:hypothetical protein